MYASYIYIYIYKHIYIYIYIYIYVCIHKCNKHGRNVSSQIDAPRFTECFACAQKRIRVEFEG